MGVGGSAVIGNGMGDQNVDMYGGAYSSGKHEEGLRDDEFADLMAALGQDGAVFGEIATDSSANVEPVATPVKPKPKPVAALPMPKNSPSSLPTYKKRTVWMEPEALPAPPPEPSTPKNAQPIQEMASSWGKLSLHREMRDEEERVDDRDQSQEIGSEEEAPSSPLHLRKLFEKAEAAQQNAALVTEYIRRNSYDTYVGMRTSAPAAAKRIPRKRARAAQPNSEIVGGHRIGRREMDALEIEPEAAEGRQTRAQKAKEPLAAPNAAAAVRKRHLGK